MILQVSRAAGNVFFVVAAVLVIIYIILSILYNLGFLDFEIINQDNNENWLVHKSNNHIPSFDYVKQNEIIKAYKIGETVMPDWVIKDGLIVVIAPMYVVALPTDDKDIMGFQGDYVVKYSDNTYAIIAEKEFERIYQKINLSE